jgi:hypothetical protein
MVQNKAKYSSTNNLLFTGLNWGNVLFEYVTFGSRVMLLLYFKTGPNKSCVLLETEISSDRTLNCSKSRVFCKYLDMQVTLKNMFTLYSYVRALTAQLFLRMVAIFMCLYYCEAYVRC